MYGMGFCIVWHYLKKSLSSSGFLATMMMKNLLESLIMIYIGSLSDKSKY